MNSNQITAIIQEILEKSGGKGVQTKGLMAVVGSFKDAVSELKKIDTLVTEISKANRSLSKSDLAKIADTSYDAASKYGKLSADYLADVQAMEKAGYKSAQSMAELSTAAQSAGNITADLANKYIIATDNAYKLNGNVKALTESLDGASNIASNHGIKMSELAEGMSMISSQAAASGMDLDETTAALATMIATTQQSGAEMAHAFKNILTNIQQMTGSIDDSALKGPMEILKELSVEYEKLDKMGTNGKSLLSFMDDENSSNALKAIVENYDMYEKLLKEYENGSGTMAREAEKTANSWEGSLNRVKNTWTDTVENIADSDAIIALINSFNGLLTVINSITDSIGSFGTLATGTAITAFVKNFDWFCNMNCLKIA